MRQFNVIFVVVVIALVAGGCVYDSPRARITQQLSAEHLAGSAIAVETQNGSVHITGGSSEEIVKIEARIICAGTTQDEADQRLAQTHFDISRDSDRTLVIKSTFPGGWRSNDGASFTIHLPAAVGVTVKTSNGSVGLRYLAGTAAIDTSNGSINISEHAGSATIDTSNGSVNVSGVLGAVTVETSNGAVDARQVSGPVQVRTSNGSIRVGLNSDAAGPIDLRTSNGSVRATVGSHFAGMIRMDTSNGSLKIRDAAGRITAKNVDENDGSITIGNSVNQSRIATSNGRIELEIAN
jgi:hypothetical protein